MMMVLSYPQSLKLPRKRWLRHVLFWIVLYFFDVIIFGHDQQNYRLFFLLVALELPGQMAMAYIIMYWAIPRYVERRYLEVAIGLTVTFFLCSLLVHWLFMLTTYYPPGMSLWNPSKLFIRGFYLFANAAIAVIIKYAKESYETERKVSEMQSSKLESELKVLKDQINPHFMFNTLNNLYGLISRNPKHAQEMILGLSRILHYMLHDTNCPTVALKKEMSCIRDYIELEKLRYPGNLSISFNTEKSVEKLQIVPLVVFPFVENSFKHGASETIDSAWINIDFSMSRSDFIFKIENTVNLSAPTPLVGGLGLSNVRRRLDLIYGDDHQLQIIDGHNSYLVVLKIRLDRMTVPEVLENDVALSDSRR